MFGFSNLADLVCESKRLTQAKDPESWPGDT